MRSSNLHVYNRFNNYVYSQHNIRLGYWYTRSSISSPRSKQCDTGDWSHLKIFFFSFLKSNALVGTRIWKYKISFFVFFFLFNENWEGNALSSNCSLQSTVWVDGGKNEWINNVFLQIKRNSSMRFCPWYHFQSLYCTKIWIEALRL